MTQAFLVAIDTDEDGREPIASAKEIASAIIDAIAKVRADLGETADGEIEVRYLGRN